jgi:dinuclear metal center YbgI/SA1388 family protein
MVVNLPYPPNMVHRETLNAHFAHTLQPELFKDYGPNGLQVEGKPQIQRLVSGVTASRALIEQAIAAQADAVVVHHGLFWRGQTGCITGWMKQRVALLLAHNINLFAYHLPLDAHLEFGNNVQLAHVLGFTPDPLGWQRFGEQQLGFVGHTEQASPEALARHVERVLGRSVTLVAGAPGPIRRVGWCTGGAQGYFEAAIEAGVQAFVTGEISEPQAHYARECGVSFLACGHHATERYGIQALAAHAAQSLGIEHRFIDVDNPA